MGRVEVKLQVANNQKVQAVKQGLLPASEAPWFELDAVVDSGSTHLVLPADVADRLQLPGSGEVSIRYADRRSGTRRVVEEVRLELQGRQGTYRAMLEPDRTTALIGAIVLEDLDFLVDCNNQRLVPRDPDRLTAEAE
jgi:predicted aspartyl protease